MAKETLKGFKERIGYEDKPVVPSCSNCAFFTSDIIEESTPYGVYRSEKNIRCLLCSERPFKVKKTAKCNNRLRWKIRDLISELHNKTAIFLVKNFDLIVIPTFEASNMVLKAARKIRAKSVRSMLSLSHFKFKEHLKFKAWEFGKRVVEVCEAYTSKTRSWDGEIVHNLGGQKFITDGNITMDRDYNGGRGVFLRSLVDSPTLASCKSAFVAIC